MFAAEFANISLDTIGTVRHIKAIMAKDKIAYESIIDVMRDLGTVIAQQFADQNKRYAARFDQIDTQFKTVKVRLDRFETDLANVG